MTREKLITQAQYYQIYYMSNSKKPIYEHLIEFAMIVLEKYKAEEYNNKSI